MNSPHIPVPEPAPKWTVSGGRAALWAGTLLAVLCGLLWETCPLPGSEERLARIPMAGDGFAGTDVPLSERERLVLGNVALVHRRYAFRDDDIHLTVIDGTRDRHAVHDPGHCFEGAGWRVVAEDHVSLPGGQGRWVRIRRDGREREAMYWFSDGGARHASFPRYCGQATWRRLTFGRSGADPVMVVVQGRTGESPDWGKLARELVMTLGL
jgi:hypothetical protein